MIELTEEQIAREYKPFQFNEQHRGWLDYIIGNPIKGSKLGSEWDHPLQHKNFSETAQMLWYFRKHPEYYEYANAETQRLLDLLGLDETQGEDPRRRFNGERGVSCNWFRYDYGPRFVKENMRIYIPSLDASIKPGILTDLIYTFGRKSLKLPQGAYEGHNRSIEDRNGNTSSLFVACAPLPYATEEDVWLGFFAPNLCTEEYMQKHARKCLGPDSSQEDVDKRVESDHGDIERLGITPLEDVANSALAFVKEFAPERYDRFSEAVSHT